VVLYEALTGHAPFHAPDDVALMEAIRIQEPDPPSQHNPGLTPALDAVLARALSKDVADRYPTAARFADALAPLLRELAPGFEPSELGAFLCRIFARERCEALEQLSEFDLDVSPDDLTPTGARQGYTRLVGIGPFAEQPPGARDLRDVVDEWLAARRAARTSEPPGEGAMPPGDEAARATEEAWSGDARPSWVEEAGRTLELEAIGSAAHETGETERPDTGVFERENETTTRNPSG
jgi:hypothetical protein